MKLPALARIPLAAIVAALVASSAVAHHSYAVFDATRDATVSGTVAKLELINPHGYLWVYVPNSSAASGYDLYGFENGPPSAMARVGWTRDTFKPGETVSVVYWPLKNGGPGGHLLRVVHADGRVTPGDPGVSGSGAKGADRTKP